MIVHALLMFLALAAGQAAQTAPATTVVIVRHAEAVAGAGSDPVLSEAGTARAAALALALKDAGVQAVMTTQYQRTSLTGQAVASSTGATLVKDTIAGGAAGLDAYVQKIAKAVQGHTTGGVILVVGHSNTVPALVKGLSGVDVGEIAHDSYDNMFIVTMTGPGAGTVVRARYGAR